MQVQKTSWSYFASFLALVPRLSLLFDIVLKSVLAALLCWSVNTEEWLSWKYCCVWHQTSILYKYLCQWDWGDYWRFLISSSSESQCSIVLLWNCTQSENMCCRASTLYGLKYLWKTILGWYLAEDSLILWIKKALES